MDDPRLSVIVPTLNRRQDLLEFTETLVQQTIQPDEFIVVDAGSVPDMKEAMLAVLEGSKIDLVYRQSDAGTSLQRNIAMELMTGEIIFMFDDDILLEPDTSSGPRSISNTKSTCGMRLGHIHQPITSPWLATTMVQGFRHDPFC